MESVSVREATLEDKDDVIGIRDDVYGGRDYLVSRYEELLTCPNTTSYVAVKNDKIVAFIAMLLIDDGHTMVTRAGRSSPAVAGQGVYKRLNAHVSLEAKKRGSQVSVFTTRKDNEAIYTDSFRIKYKEILNKTMVRFFVDTTSITIPSEDDIVSLSEPGDREIESYFTNKHTRAYLFPHDRMIGTWVPYKLLTSNLSHMRRPHYNKHVISDVREGDDGNPRGLFSISGTFQCVNPPYSTDLDIYGTDAASLKQHIVSHFRFMKNIFGGVINLLVFIDPEFDMKQFHKVFAEVGLEENVWYLKDGMKNSTLLLFETELQ